MYGMALIPFILAMANEKVSEWNAWAVTELAGQYLEMAPTYYNSTFVRVLTLRSAMTNKG